MSTFGGGGINGNTDNLKNCIFPSSDRAARTEVQLLNGAGGTAAALSPILLGLSTAAAQNSGRYDVVGGAAPNDYPRTLPKVVVQVPATSSTVQYTITYP